MIHTQSEIDNLVELAIIQRAELKKLVDSLPQLRDHLSSEIERNLEEIEPAIRSELEQLVIARAQDAHAQSSAALTAKVDELGKALEVTTAARYSVLMAEREQNASLLAQAEARIAEAASALPSAVKSIVTDELSRFPRAGEIDQLRKEFAEPKGLNPRGKWSPDETYQRLDLVTFNGDSFVSNIDGNRERPSRSAADWTLNAARGNSGGGGGVTSITDLLPIPSSGQILGSEGPNYVPKNLVAGSNITITETPTTITITGDEGQIELQDGTAAAPSLFFVNDTDTGLFRVGANTLGIAVGGTQAAAISSATFAITPNTTIAGTLTANGTSIPASKTLVVTTDKISVLAATSSAELAGVISDETGTGSLVFASSPTLVTPDLGTPSALVGTNITGTAAGLTAGNVTTNANLTGDVTSVGNATSIAAGVIVDADINASAAIADTKLATISTAGKVSNSATTATSANTASAIVARDASGNFTAGTITANLTGNVSGSSGSTTGNAATATALATGRTISITGDLAYTSPSFDGTGNVTAAGTLATVATPGSTGSSTAIPIVTINAKGLTTSITTAAVIAPAGTLSGNTLAAGVTASSLTSLGTIASLTATAGTVATTPTASTDIANKLYVDTVAQGLDAKASCVAATTADITLSGAQTIDGVSIVAGNRVLVKNQTLSENNGIYLCASGSWTRTTDANTWDALTSAFTFIEQGTVNADCGFVCTANAGGTLGTTSLPWSQFSGAGTFTAGTGLTLTGSVFSLTSPVAVANGGTGLTSLGSGVATFLGTPSSANLAAAVSDETGSGALVFASSPTLVTPTLGAATATSLNGVTLTGTSTPALSVSGTASVSGSNTGDQTTITGNAGTATILQTARNINGVSFNGSADITVTAAAGTLTGATLASGVTASSLTSLGTITSLTATALTVNDNTTLGSSNSDTVNFNARIASDLNPSTDDTYDLGIVGHEWRNLRIDGTANIDSLVADTADINGGTIDGTAIGATTPSTGAFTTLTTSGTATFTKSANSAGSVAALLQNADGNSGIGARLAWRLDNLANEWGYINVNRVGGGATAQMDIAVNGAAFSGAPSVVASLTTAGLAVTGALSSTGILSGPGFRASKTTATSGLVKIQDEGANVYNVIGSRNNADSAALPLNFQASNFDFNGAVAVTGALSNTNTITVSGTSATGVSSINLNASDFSSGPSFTTSILYQNGNSATGTTVGLSNAGLGSLYFQNVSNALIWTNSGVNMVFGTASTERMRINATGLGIGTTSPASKLHISGDANTRLQIDATTTQGIFFTKAGVDNGTFRVDTNGNFEFFTKTVNQAMVLTAAGNVGIGTTSPLNKLQVSDASLPIIRVKLDANSNGTILYDNATTSDLIVVDGRPLTFGTNNTERVRIDATGNVGIGVTSFGTSAAKVLGIANGTAPSSSPAGMGQLYVESGALKYRGSSGTVTTIANA
jgi:hypothetical protein